MSKKFKVYYGLTMTGRSQVATIVKTTSKQRLAEILQTSINEVTNHWTETGNVHSLAQAELFEPETVLYINGNPYASNPVYEEHPTISRKKRRRPFISTKDWDNWDKVVKHRLALGRWLEDTKGITAGTMEIQEEFDKSIKMKDEDIARSEQYRDKIIKQAAVERRKSGIFTFSTEQQQYIIDKLNGVNDPVGCDIIKILTGDVE